MLQMSFGAIDLGKTDRSTDTAIISGCFVIGDLVLTI